MWLEQGDFAIINMLDKHVLVSIGQGLLNAMWNTVMKRARTVVAAAMVSVLPALAEEYHVSPDGDDSADGSSARPWRTIQRAADAAVAGDVVVVHGGVYREWVKPANAGREDAPQLGTGFALYLSGTWQAGQLSAAHPAETVFGQ